MKRFSLKQGFQIAAVAILSLAVFSPAVNADEYNRKTVITISQPLEVPGVVLPPGTYVMRLFNSSSNRHIVQIMNETQQQQLALTFAVSAERIRPTGKTVFTMYEGSQGAPPAIRTWFYPGDVVGQEFLYPRQQALRISARTKTVVPEIEDGKATASQETAAAVPAAEPVQATESRDESVLIARAEPAPAPAPEPAPIAAPEPAPEPQQPAEAQSPAADSVQVAQAAPSASDETLPRTASNGPLAALIGGLSIVLAFGIRRMGRSRTQ